MQIKTVVLLLSTMRAVSQPIINGRRPPALARQEGGPHTGMAMLQRLRHTLNHDNCPALEDGSRGITNIRYSKA